jgi:hypothetical protein
MLQNLIALLYVLLGIATYPLFAYLVIARRFAAIERAIPGLSRWDLAYRFMAGKPLLDLNGVEPIPAPENENAES